MQKLDIAASERCLGQAEPTEHPVCALDGGTRAEWHTLCLALGLAGIYKLPSNLVLTATRTG